MKLRFTLLLGFFLLSLVSFAQDSATPKGPEFKWEETQFDFGKIPQGVPASHEYWFTNTGGDTLLIADVKKPADAQLRHGPGNRFCRDNAGMSKRHTMPLREEVFKKLSL